MKAIIYEQYGGPEVLQIREVERPVPGDDEVLIRVRAVSLNDWDFGLLKGDFINRTMNGMSKPKRKILGSDIAGIVEARGKNVTRFQPGDEVYGDLSGRWGGFAEYTCAPETSIELKSPGMSFVEAASIPQAGMLAVQGLIDKGKIQSGLKILINGAGGGVGTFGVQIAKTYNAEITGVDHGTKLEMMRYIGFDHVIDYTKEDFTATGHQYHLILDTKTNRSAFRYMRSLYNGGRYVTIGGSIKKLLGALVLSPLISLTNKKKVSIVSLKPNKDLLYFNEQFEKGNIKPVIHGPYSLGEFQEAFRTYENAAHKGKVVINMD